MKRHRGQVVGLLDLPAEVLHLILSFLGTLSLAAVRLTCQALKHSATPDRQLVEIEVPGDRFRNWCTAKARASPRVLSLMHTFASMQARLNDVEQGAGGEGGLGRGSPGHRPTRAWLQTEFLAEVAREFEVFEINSEWRLCAEQQGPDPRNQLLCQPRVMLSKMSALTTVCVERPLDSATLHVLASLPHLACLKLTYLYQTLDFEDFLQQLCIMPALARLELDPCCARCAQGKFISLSTLVFSKATGLQHLAIPLPASEFQHLDMLTALTGLTSLHVRSLKSSGNWSSLTTLTGLKQLRMEAYMEEDDSETDFNVSADIVLTPLSALLGLTHLDIADLEGARTEEADFSVLSYLTALRVLRCNFFQKARFADGDALPIQLRVLVTAAALEELNLGFLGSFWTMPLDSIHAMQHAVSSLASLKAVTVRIEDGELKQHSSPFAVFAAAPSLEALTFWASRPGWCNSLPDETHDLARACFKSLKKLKSLNHGAEAPSHFTELVFELPSTQLTRLSLHLGTVVTLPLMQRIAGFRGLQDVSLSMRNLSLRVLEPLFELKEVTHLCVTLPAHGDFLMSQLMHQLSAQSTWEVAWGQATQNSAQPGFVSPQESPAGVGFSQGGGAFAKPAVDELWTQLEAVIVESARRVGVRSFVRGPLMFAGPR